MNFIQTIPDTFYKNKKLCLILVAAGLIFLAIVTIYRGAFRVPASTDLTVYLRAAEAIVNGENIYAVENARHWHYVYLPLLAILMVPMSFLPIAVNVALWYGLSVYCLIQTILFLFSQFHDEASPRKRNLLFWAAALCIPVMLSSLARGQLGTLSLFLIFASFYASEKKHDGLAGFILGFAMILKLSPTLLVGFYFLFQKKWKTLFACFFAGCLFGIALPFFIYGAEGYLEVTEDYFRHISLGSSDMAHTSHLWGELFNPFGTDNQSIYAVLTRLFWGEAENMIGNSNALIRGFSNIFLLINIALVFFASLKVKTAIEKFCILSLTCFLMIFSSPVSEMHHFSVHLFLYLSAFIMGVTHNKKSLIILPLISFTGFNLGFIFKEFAYIGLPFWTTYALWFALTYNLIKKK